jgi:putative membrane protein insertion efficiency factor
VTSPAGRGAIHLIRVYQQLSAHRLSPCRFIPSCSEYAAVAIEEHGAMRGGALAARRLSRCHPFGGHGVDPVPPNRRAPEPRP